MRLSKNFRLLDLDFDLEYMFVFGLGAGSMLRAEKSCSVYDLFSGIFIRFLYNISLNTLLFHKRNTLIKQR